jgi:hypothetical protein
MPGVQLARSLVCKKKAYEHSHHRSAATIGTPCANGFTAFFALSPGIGLSCPRHLRIIIRKLGASVEASGPHDFTVRFRRVRPAHRKRPSHPAPNVK